MDNLKEFLVTREDVCNLLLVCNVARSLDSGSKWQDLSDRLLVLLYDFDGKVLSDLPPVTALSYWSV